MYDPILHHCFTEKPNLIYVGIGCALPYESPNSNQIQQQLPNFIRDWEDAQILDGVRKVCVLLDPLLEYPPRLFGNALSKEDDPMLPTPLEPLVYDRDTLVFPIRREFHYNRPTDADFLHALCHLCVQEKGAVKLVVQDYTGRDIRPFYPTKDFGDWIHPYVLYDFTHGSDNGCFVDFSKVEILRFPGSGNFIQPSCFPLHLLQIYTKRHSPILQHEINRRTDAIKNCLWHFYRIQIGVLEPSAWCTAEHVKETLRSVVGPYELPVSLEPSNLRVVMMLILEDVARITGHPITRTELQRIFDSVHSEFINTLVAIRSCDAQM
jgi:hypothetical protein